MVLFKINGERNSGTLFLEYLLSNNGFPTYVHTADASGVHYHWKHGVPTPDYKLLDDRVVDIFIFRKLEEWLVSTWKQPYHLVPIDDFGEFLTKKQQAQSNIFPQISDIELTDYRTGLRLNSDDDGKTIFEIRYYKYRKIMEYAKTQEDVIFVGLSFLQDAENAREFLAYLDARYCGLETDNKSYILEIDKHTKTNREKEKNQMYNDVSILDYRDTINKYLDADIERIIQDLSFFY